MNKDLTVVENQESLITLSNTPKINYTKLQEKAEEVKRELERLNVGALEVSEENVKEVKRLRTKVKKEFDSFETGRKNIKKLFMNPYSEFEDWYKENITKEFSKVDSELSEKINEIEDGIRASKHKELSDYFDEINSVEWLQLGQLGLKVMLSTNMNDLKFECQARIGKVEMDLRVIETQPEPERVLVQYKKTLDLNSAIIETQKAIELEKELKDMKMKRIVENQTHDLFHTAIDMEKEKQQGLQAPIVEEKPVIAKFKVKATKSKLKSLKEFMEREGIEIVEE